MTRTLQGDDSPWRWPRGLPAREFLSPWPLLALALLGINDHLLKPWAAFPRPLAGKLSDLAGLFYFPLLLTAAYNTASYWLLGQRADRYPLTRCQLLLAIGFSGAVYSLLKCSGGAASWAFALVEAVSGVQRIVVLDPTDMLALLVLPLTYLHGQRFVSRTGPCVSPVRD